MTTFIFKIIFYILTIIFITRSDETASSKRRNNVKMEFDFVDNFPNTNLRNTKRPYWDPYSYNHQRGPVHQSPINQNHLHPNKIQISLDFIQRDKDDLEVKDMLPNFVEGEEEDGSIISSNFGIVERSATVVSHSEFAIFPKDAKCNPEETTVETVHNDDPSVLYIPSCTRLPRCGGCCNNPKFSCQPIEWYIVTLQVVKTQLQGGKLRNMGREYVQASKHSKCICKCILQPQECTSLQSFNRVDCSCTCLNSNEKQKCLNENEDKLWNSDTCRCRY